MPVAARSGQTPCSCRCSRARISPMRVRSARPLPQPSARTAAEGAPSGWPRSSAITRRPRSRGCAGPVRWPTRRSRRRRRPYGTGPEDGRDNPQPTLGHGDWPGHEAHPHQQAADPARAPLGGRPAGRPARPGHSPGQGASRPQADRFIPKPQYATERRAVRNWLSAGIPLAVVVLAAVAAVALRTGARRPGPREVLGTETPTVAATAEDSPPQPGQVQHVFHELHAEGQHALCEVCAGQYQH
jgi:hypothetical protein